MRKFMKVVWIINAILSGIVLLIDLVALTFDRYTDAMTMDWYILFASWFSILLSLTFIALLDDRKPDNLQK